MVIMRKDTRADAEFDAYCFDSEFGYDFRFALEEAEHSEKRVFPYKLLKEMKEANPIHQRNVSLLMESRNKRFVT
jgi:hypothetical protein